MPANEQTWRDQKALHAVFGISSVLLLLSTVWMLADDHNREWKQYKRKFRTVETWVAQSRISQQESDAYQKKTVELETALDETRKEVPPKEEFNAFTAEISREAESRGESPPDFSSLEAAYEKVDKAEPTDRPALRVKLLGRLEKYVTDAKFRENNLLGRKKFKSADFDVARSNYELAIGNGKPQEELDLLQTEVDKVKSQVEELALQVQDATTHRKDLEETLGKITAKENAALKQLTDHKQQLGQLQAALYERADNAGKELLEMPVLDAFGGPLKPDQIWLPKLTFYNNFRDVARFDRCTTCHQAIDRTAPGSAVEPGYRHETEIKLTLATPAEPPAVNEGETPTTEKRLLSAFGLGVADHGLLAETDATVSVIVPEGPAAKAKLLVGDVITHVGDAKLLRPGDAERYLLDTVAWGQPLPLTIRRGLPHPYTSHPRLDLFVGSLSPHKMQDIGCTICHEGQGSATAFKWASHTPNNPQEATEWRRDHGWFNNHHWIFPMNPQRFLESGCLKCHHEVTELEPSKHFPEPPAPQLIAGYNTIRQYGCFGCHEINGFDGPNRRVGPDLRAEPNYAAAAAALIATGELDDDQQSWAKQLAAKPELDQTRRLLLDSIRAPAPKTEAAEAKSKPISVSTKKLADILDDVESPGKFRKVGPSLRNIGKKSDFDFLYSWIRNPLDFRPSTRMPRFFGLHDHLSGKGLETAEQLEPLEIRGITEYLLNKTQDFTFAGRPDKVTEDPSAERGKRLFETRGCLACHQHKDFPKAAMNQGPDLSRIGAKLDRPSNPDGPKWLYSWLKNPSSYHPRTVMPNLILEPAAVKDEKGNDTDKFTDPAADISAYLLSSRGWEPKDVPGRKLTAEEVDTLRSLAKDHLTGSGFTEATARKYLDGGIPPERRKDLKGDEVELIGDPSTQKLLNYVGRRSVSKYGCSGCHDVPGFEDAKPIGTGLADWGRKAADKLAFEQIGQFLSEHGVNGENSHAHGDAHGNGHGAHEGGGSGHGHIDVNDLDPDTGFYMQSLMSHERTGFIWQKLRAPRSYDYKKTENKGYNERLRMPKFNLTSQQIEQVMTFVLGLVNEPPALQYIYKPTPRRQAIVEGAKIIDKYNCTGCHTTQMERWELAFAPDAIPPAGALNEYPFLAPHFPVDQVVGSAKSDVRGLRHATVYGTPSISDQTGDEIRLDEDGAPIDPTDKTTPGMYKFQLWRNATLGGEVRLAGVQDLLIPEKSVEQRYPAEGGYLPKLIYPDVVKFEREVNPQAKSEEAWGWLPPPLVNEGKKVRADWLHDFLLNPYPIRPAVVLRMPKFNMSPAEASALVNYFAAVDNAKYPYEENSRAVPGLLSKDEKDEMQSALKVITDNNYCVKCHLVGDFAPTGSDRAKGPQLAAVYKRFRPDFLEAWIANPKRLLPYTGMPVNIPPDKPVSQELFKGTSRQQVDGLVDFLMNYNKFAESQTSIAPMVKPAAPAAPADAAPANTEKTEKSASE